jgi:hypothetical protein
MSKCPYDHPAASSDVNQRSRGLVWVRAAQEKALSEALTQGTLGMGVTSTPYQSIGRHVDTLPQGSTNEDVTRVCKIITNERGKRVVACTPETQAGGEKHVFYR